MEWHLLDGFNANRSKTEAAKVPGGVLIHRTTKDGVAMSFVPGLEIDPGMPDGSEFAKLVLANTNGQVV